jgi:integrase
VELYEKGDSKYLWYDFTVAGNRYRGSTKETNKTRAAAIAALKLAEITEGRDPIPRRAPRLEDLSKRFLGWIKDLNLQTKSKLYYRDGCRLLAATAVSKMRVDTITDDDIERLRFEGSSSTANCALRTLRRMLHKSVEWKLIRKVPKIRLMKEYGRSLRLDDDAERKLFVGAEKCGWDALTLQLFKDIIVLVRDTGTRNERELYRLRIEHINWDTKVIYVPESKTLAGRREVPMSDRVTAVLARRCGANQEGFVFPSKRSSSGHLTTIARRFREARGNAGLSKNLVLYCARHDFGSRVLARTGNLAAVMKTMGHKDVKTAMRYQHPELEPVRAALNWGSSQAAEKDCDGLEKQVTVSATAKKL